MNSKQSIIEDMKVKPSIDTMQEIVSRIDFIKDTLINTKTKKLVLGISGGVDSTLAGRLCQLAVDEMNMLDAGYEFIAVRLPHSVQADEDDAQAALAFIKPTRTVTVNIQNGTSGIHDSTLSGMYEAGLTPVSGSALDFAKGNVKARMRMIAQYEIAGLVNGLVVGTDHSAEAVTGFYTKHGDGACDMAPLFGLNKRQVRSLAERLNAPKHLWAKAATADLEEDRPQLSDEEALGVTYDEIDNFLEGNHVKFPQALKIIQRYEASAHKRSLPVTP